MNPKLLTKLNLNNSGLGCLLTLILIGFIFGSLGILGGVVKGLLIILALLFLLPPIAWIGIKIGINWLLKRNLVIQPCPVCETTVTTLKQNQAKCPGCGELLEVKGGKLNRVTPPNTIDVTVVDDNY